MITVEELVIQSLYHRLVLVNVKRHPPSPGGGGGPRNGGAGAGSGPDPDPRQAGSGVNGQAGAVSAVGGHAPQSPPREKTGKHGLGFLVMNAMSPHMKKAFGVRPNGRQSRRSLPACAVSPRSSSPEGESEVDDQAPATSDAQVTRIQTVVNMDSFDMSPELQAVLDTGNIQLVKSVLRAEGGQAAEHVATWLVPHSIPGYLWPAAGEEEVEEGQQEESGGALSTVSRSGQIQVAGVPLDLGACDQFSIVKFEDIRDPNRKSIVMVETDRPPSGPARKEIQDDALGVDHAEEQTLAGGDAQLAIERPGSLTAGCDGSGDHNVIATGGERQSMRPVHGGGDGQASKGNMSLELVPEGGASRALSPLPSPLVSTNTMVFVTHGNKGKSVVAGRECEEYREGEWSRGAKKGDGCQRRSSDMDLDSGIWEMVHELECKINPRNDAVSGGVSPNDAASGGVSRNDAAYCGVSRNDALSGGVSRGDAVSGGVSRSDAVSGGVSRNDAVSGGFSRNDAVSGGVSRNDAVSGGFSRNDAVSGGVSRNDAVSGGVSRNDAVSGGFSRNDAVSGGVSRNDAVSGGVSRNDAVSGGFSRKDALPGGVSRSDAASGGFSRNDAVSGGVSRNDAVSGGVSRSDAVSGGVSRSDALPGGVSRKDAVSGGVSRNDAAYGGVSRSDAASGGVSRNDATYGGVSRNDALSGGVSRGDAVSGGVSRGDAVSGGVSRSDAVSGGVSRNDAVSGGVSRNDAVSGGVSRNDAVSGGFSRNDAVSGGVSRSDAVSRGVSRNDAVPGGVSRNDAVSGAVSRNDAVSGGVSLNDAVSGGVSRSDALPGGVSRNDAVSGGFSRNDAAYGGVSRSDAAYGGVSRNDAVSGGVSRNDAAYGGVSRSDAASGGFSRKDAVSGGVSRSDAASGGFSRKDAVSGGVSRSDAASGGFSRKDAVSGGVSRNDAASGGFSRKDAVSGGVSRSDAASGGFSRNDAVSGGLSRTLNYAGDTRTVKDGAPDGLCQERTPGGSGDPSASPTAVVQLRESPPDNSARHRMSGVYKVYSIHENIFCDSFEPTPEICSDSSTQSNLAAVEFQGVASPKMAPVPAKRRPRDVVSGADRGTFTARKGDSVGSFAGNSNGITPVSSQTNTARRDLDTIPRTTDTIARNGPCQLRTTGSDAIAPPRDLSVSQRHNGLTPDAVAARDKGVDGGKRSPAALPLISRPVAQVEFTIEAEETEDDSTVSTISDIQYEVNGSLPMSPEHPSFTNHPASPAKRMPGSRSHLEPEPGAGFFQDGSGSLSPDEILHQEALFNAAASYCRRSPVSGHQEAQADVAWSRSYGSSVGRQGAYSNTTAPPTFSRSPVGVTQHQHSVQSHAAKPKAQSVFLGAQMSPPTSPNKREFHTPMNDFSGEEHPVFTDVSPGESPTSPATAARQRHWRNHDPTSPRAQVMNDSFVRNLLQGAADGVAAISASGDKPRGHDAGGGSGRRGRVSSVDTSGGISAALRPPSRVITYRDPMTPRESVGSHDLSDSYLSSDGDDHSLYDVDLAQDAPEFTPHPDWMSQLPARLHDIPLTRLAIPGSHIAMGVDRDMRTDMDFSKCSYDMADFLRRLPNLAIFNNFRTLMKKIWRAWMPKQTLSLYHQLAAGARYFDMRITKLRGAFLAEHGLYTRRLKRYLKEIRLFLDQHPKEVAILHFRSLDQLDRSDKRRLVTMMFQMFGARLARVASPGATTLTQLWRGKKQVVLFFPETDMDLLSNHIFGGLVWSDAGILASPGPAASATTVAEMVAAVDAGYAQDKHLLGKDKLCVLKPVLSPDMTMVFGEFKYRSMRELTSRETCGAVCEWLADKQTLNVVVIDFVGEGDLVSNILQVNDAICKHTVV